MTLFQVKKLIHLLIHLIHLIATLRQARVVDAETMSSDEDVAGEDTHLTRLETPSIRIGMTALTRGIDMWRSRGNLSSIS